MGKRKLVAKLFKNWKDNQTEEDGDVPESCSVQGINRVLSTSSKWTKAALTARRWLLKEGQVNGSEYHHCQSETFSPRGPWSAFI